MRFHAIAAISKKSGRALELPKLSGVHAAQPALSPQGLEAPAAKLDAPGDLRPVDPQPQDVEGRASPNQ